MGVQIPVGFGQVRCVYQLGGSVYPSIVTWNYDPGTIDPAAHIDSIYSAVVHASGPVQASRINDNWIFLGVQITEVDDTGPISAEKMVSVVGTFAGGSLPPNCAVLLRKSTGLGGRRNRGRMFVPPVWPVEGSVSGAGVLGTGIPATIEGWWNFTRTTMATAGFPWVLCHSEAPFTPTPITGLSCDTRVASQRRRLRR